MKLCLVSLSFWLQVAGALATLAVETLDSHFSKNDIMTWHDIHMTYTLWERIMPNEGRCLKSSNGPRGAAGCGQRRAYSHISVTNATNATNAICKCQPSKKILKMLLHVEIGVTVIWIHSGYEPKVADAAADVASPALKVSLWWSKAFQVIWIWQFWIWIHLIVHLPSLGAAEDVEEDGQSKVNETWRVSSIYVLLL